MERDINEKNIDDSTGVAKKAEANPDATYHIEGNPGIEGATISGAGAGPSTGDPSTSPRGGTNWDTNEFGVGYPEAEFMANPAKELKPDSPDSLSSENELDPSNAETKDTDGDSTLGES